MKMRFAGALLALFVAAPVHAATLYLSEFANGVSQVGTTTPQIYPQPAITDQTVAIGATSSASAAFNAKTHAVLAVCDEGCSVVVGSSPTAAATNFLLFQGTPVEFAVSPGQKIAVIANAAGNSGGSSGITIGTTTITGGTTTRLLYDAAGVVGEISGATSNGTALTLVAPVLGAATGTSLALGGATIGSNALAVTGAAAISGNVLVGPGTAAAPSFSFVASPQVGFLNVGGAIEWAGNGTANGIFGASYFAIPAANSIRWSSTADPLAITDVGLWRDAANTLAQRNGVNAQADRVYNSFTDASNYERGVFDWQASSNVLTIGTQVAGTGTNRNVFIQGQAVILNPVTGNTYFATNGTLFGEVNTAGLTIGATNSADIGASADLMRTGYFGTSLRAPVYASVGAVPTLALAGGTCAGTVIAGGSTAGTVTLTGACVATNTLTLSVMPTAPTGYSCDAVDRTLGVSDLGETSTSTTGAVFTFGGTTGATDVIQYKCIAY